jgi:hypothetical protein
VSTGGGRRRVHTRPPLWRAVGRRRRGWIARNPLAGTPKGRPDALTRVRRVLWVWWPWALAALVLVHTGHWWWALGTGVVALLARLMQPKSAPPRFGLEHHCAVGADDFLATLAGATGAPFLPGNTFEVLHNGDAFYPRMLADIRAATTTVTIEAYIYWAGEVGSEFADALAERARAGVRVAILLDAVGASDIGEATLARLTDGGCQVAWYNPFRGKTLGSFNMRTHR